MARTVIDCARVRGRAEVIAWFAEHGFDASDFAARSASDDIVVDDGGQVLVRRYLRGSDGIILVDPHRLECRTEPVVIAARRPFPAPA